MRLTEANYLKAFPREDKPKAPTAVPAGNVIEEAEKQEPEKKTIKESEPDNVIDEVSDDPDQEGDDA